MAGPKSHAGRRNKGNRGEREFFAILNKYLPERLRLKRELAQSRDGGVDGSSTLVAIEVKRQERLNLPSWLRQAREAAQPTQVPSVAYRQNNEPWRVLVEMTPLQFAVYMRWQNNMRDTEAAITAATEALD